MPGGVEVVVATFSVEDPDPPLIEAGVKLPVAPEGKPLTPNDTLLLKPFDGETETV